MYGESNLIPDYSQIPTRGDQFICPFNNINYDDLHDTLLNTIYKRTNIPYRNKHSLQELPLYGVILSPSPRNYVDPWVVLRVGSP